MSITLTENAARQINSQIAKRGKGLGLRVGVKKVGCSGFAYTFDYADEIDSSDRVVEAHGAKLVVGEGNLAFLEGARLDFIREGFKQVFRFENPNIDSTCGCGESFRFKSGEEGRIEAAADSPR